MHIARLLFPMLLNHGVCVAIAFYNGFSINRVLKNRNKEERGGGGGRQKKKDINLMQFYFMVRY